MTRWLECMPYLCSVPSKANIPGWGGIWRLGWLGVWGCWGPSRCRWRWRWRRAPPCVRSLKCTARGARRTPQRQTLRRSCAQTGLYAGPVKTNYVIKSQVHKYVVSQFFCINLLCKGWTKKKWTGFRAYNSSSWAAIIKQEGRSVIVRFYIVAFSHILETAIIFHRFRYMMPYQWNISQNLISYSDLARLVPIKKPYSLHQSASVGDQNGIWILGLYHFVLEEFDHNIANYVSS